MADTVSPETRSRMMSQVRAKDTEPEKIVRSILHGMGYRYRLYSKYLPGKPDIVLSRHEKIIFVHGCFWHGHKDCDKAKRPSSNVSFWNKKLDSNIARDALIRRQLESDGWKILVIWECETYDSAELKSKINTFMKEAKA